MTFLVRLTADAARDLRLIHEYIEQRDSRTSADHVVRRIGETFNSLSEFPERGTRVQDLLEMGVSEYREVLFKPYRIIYQVTDDVVHVHVIVDGRRDMRALLLQRLLRA